ncbi:MAG: class I SAM-dependent methyltransferase [Candidatus Dormibacteria bacterium]
MNPGPGLDADPERARTTEESLYNRAAGRFTAPVAHRIVEWIDVRRGDCVLDIGSGTGLMALAAAHRAGPTGDVLGVDTDDAALALARAAALEAGVSARFEHMDAHELRYPPGHFDAVTCAFVLMFLEHRGEVLMRVRDMLRVHGSVAVATWTESPDRDLREVLLKPLEREMNDAQRARSQRSIALGDPEYVSDLLRGAGFTAVEFEPFRTSARYESPDDAWEAFGGIETERGREVMSHGADAWERARLVALRNLRDLGPWPRELHRTALLVRGSRPL